MSIGFETSTVFVLIRNSGQIFNSFVIRCIIQSNTFDIDNVDFDLFRLGEEINKLKDCMN